MNVLTRRVHLLLAVSAASPVTSDGDCPYSHQEDDHHVVVQHRLVRRIHGNESSFPKGLRGLKNGMKAAKRTRCSLARKHIILHSTNGIYKRLSLGDGGRFLYLAYVQHVRVAEQCDGNVNLFILGLVSCWWGLQLEEKTRIRKFWFLKDKSRWVERFQAIALGSLKTSCLCRNTTKQYSG